MKYITFKKVLKKNILNGDSILVHPCKSFFFLSQNQTVSTSHLQSAQSKYCWEHMSFLARIYCKMRLAGVSSYLLTDSNMILAVMGTGVQYKTNIAADELA